MTNQTQLRRLLAQADPARDLDPAPREDLLAQLLAEPRPAPLRSRRTQRRLVAPALVLAAATTIAGTAVLVSASGPASLDLAATAYARTSSGAGQILHSSATWQSTETSTTGVVRSSGSLEEWHRGTQAHRIDTYEKGGRDVTVEYTVSANGVLREDDDGDVRVLDATAGGDAPSTIAEGQTGFVDGFRRAYAQGELDPAGDVQFAGRPARRYVVSQSDAAVPAQAFYLDRETGAPLGYTSTLQEQITNGDGSTTPATLRFVETVGTIETLPSTPANVQRVDAFGR